MRLAIDVYGGVLSTPCDQHDGARLHPTRKCQQTATAVRWRRRCFTVPGRDGPVKARADSATCY